MEVVIEFDSSSFLLCNVYHKRSLSCKKDFSSVAFIMCADIQEK